ncbi:MAG TPA: uroporphyrinogen-III synthase [Rhizomicrobium sp.]|nr:uroporphyrinogen-III synthase [Rhizomicrobium sp.]
MRILVTRPLEDGVEIAQRLAALGHQPLLAPLLTPHFRPGPPLEEGPALDDVQAILVTSANGIRALAPRTARRDLAIFAVGPQTAEEAYKARFSQVKNADGDAGALAEAVLRWASRDGVLLHVCSQDAPGTLADILSARGFTVRRCPLYEIAAASSLPDETRVALRQRALDAVMFFSPRTARIFGALAEGLPTDNLTAFCISPATAQALAPGAFAHIKVAERPNQSAMLAMV